MAAVTPLNVYICANISLVFATGLLEGLRAISPMLRRPVAYSHQLRMGQAAALAALVLPLCSSLSGGTHLMPRTAQVWSAPTLRDGAHALTDRTVAVTFGASRSPIPLATASQVVALLFVAGLLYVLARLARDAAATLRIIADAQTIRRHRSARILASERIIVPFSFWLPRRHFIIVPSALVLRGSDLRLAIRHEAQHHRQHDTKLLYLHQLLEALFFCNPAVHRLQRQLRELQELSCDEALGAQRGVCVRDYCQCLLRVGEAAVSQRRGQLQASMVGGGTGKLLRRRVEALLARPAAHLPRSLVCITGAIALTLMATAALAITSTIRDRRISAEQAESMATSARIDSTFPIVVNDRVTRELNLLLSTPDGRAYMKESLSRMRSHEPFISDQLARYSLPLELLAVPLVESGYRNQPQSGDRWQGAGLWMFIEDTAREYGLLVDAACDQRLDIAAETEAAIRLLGELQNQFGDWGLVLLAFNAGADRVERGIAETSSRDVWTLIAQGHENDAGYVARVMAAILIIRNPGVLD
jgi:peptidoglycan lytic transglycosylase D